MARNIQKRQRQKNGSRHAYLVRPCMYWALPAGEACGYYFSLEEAEAVKRELDAQYPEELHIIEEYTLEGDTNPGASHLVTKSIT